MYIYKYFSPTPKKRSCAVKPRLRHNLKKELFANNVLF